jgi:outer membrane lipoprotein-sorting protein
MNRLHATLYVVLLFLILISPSASANGRLDEILTNMQNAGSRVKSIEASVEQAKRLTIGGSEVYRGVIYFKHAGRNNDKVRITYRSGSQVTQDVAIVGQSITLYQPAIKQVIKTSLQSQAARDPEFSFVSTPYQSVPELKRRYDITYGGDEKVGSTATCVLDLVPKTTSSVQRLRLWVSQTDWLPIRYRVFENTGDVTTFTLTDVKINSSMPDSRFSIDWPRGTTVIRK